MNANELTALISECLREIDDHKFFLKLESVLRQQQAEIEAMRTRFTLAFWHDTFVEVKKPNSDLIYRFKLDDVCKHGVDDGACKECYIKEQEK
jgi:hypothetical protein